MTNIYERGLGRNDANHVPLSPISFLNRTASVHPDRTAVVHGPLVRTWRETAERCRRLASALRRRGYGQGDTIAIMAPNVPEFLEAGFGAPMTGGVLNALNVRLDAEAIAFMLNHGEAKVLIADRAFADTVEAALARTENRPLVVDIDDPLAGGAGRLVGDTTYEDLLAEGDPRARFHGPDDEWRAIALNYTSGTTGDPKGVVYSHRGAWMNGLGNAVTWAMPHFPVYLWTLPMFHCNGWCFPWTVTAMAGTHVCLRGLTADAILSAIAEHRVTHLCGAPVVMAMMLSGDDALWDAIAHPVKMMTAGAAPPAAVLERMEARGVEVTHVYGLTEVYGPAAVCEWRPEWDGLPADEKAALKARQGVTYVVQEGLTVVDPETMAPVPADGRTMGEIAMRGNVTMAGYLKNETATRKAFEGGWFRTGDLAVGASRRLRRDQGPLQGHRDLRRRERLDHRGGGRALPPSGGGRGGRGRQARRDLGRDALRLRRPAAGRRGDRAGDRRFLPRQPRPLQMPAPCGLRRSAEDVDRQDPEVRAAGTGEGAVTPRRRGAGARFTPRASGPRPGPGSGACDGAGGRRRRAGPGGAGSGCPR